MTLKDFIENLKILSERHPDTIVPNPERYSISVTDTLSSNGTAQLFYNWREAVTTNDKVLMQKQLHNQLNNSR